MGIRNPKSGITFRTLLCGSQSRLKSSENTSCLDSRLGEKNYELLCGQQSPRSFGNCTDAAKMTPYLTGSCSC